MEDELSWGTLRRLVMFHFGDAPNNIEIHHSSYWGENLSNEHSHPNDPADEWLDICRSMPIGDVFQEIVDDYIARIIDKPISLSKKLGYVDMVCLVEASGGINELYDILQDPFNPLPPIDESRRDMLQLVAIASSPKIEREEWYLQTSNISDRLSGLILSRPELRDEWIAHRGST